MSGAPALRSTHIVAYGLPGFPLAVLGVPLYIYLPPYYASTLGVGTVGVILLAARIWDMLTDPLIGGLGDRLRTRFGRRRPLMLLGTPLLLIAVHQLFMPPPDAGATHLLTWSFLAYLAWTLVALPYTAWGAELSQSYHQRSSIAASREACIIVGMLTAIVLPAVAIPEAASAASLELLAWMVWVSLPLAVIAVIRLVPETGAFAQPVPWRQGLQLLRANRPFFRLLAAYLCNGLANGIPATLFLLYADNVLQAGTMAGPMLITYFLAGVVGMPVFLALARRIGKHRAWSLSMLWATAAFAWVPLLGEGDVWPFLLICALAGLSLGVDMALPASIQADLVDLDTARGGGGRTGLFFGLWGMATKLALALAVGISFPLLALAGFEPGSAAPDGLLILALLYGAAPIPLKLIAVALIWNFPLDEQRQQQLRQQIHGAPQPSP